MVPLPPIKPRDSFRSYGRSIPVAHTLGVVLAVTVVVTVAGFAVGSVLVQAVDPGATVPNPEKPDDAFCERQAESFPDMPTPSGCDAPEEVPARDVLRDAVPSQMSGIVLAVPFAWLLGSGFVHLLSRAADGDGSFGTTAGIVAWSLVPSAVQSLLVLGAFHLLLGGRSVSEVERLPDVVRGVANHPLILGISVLGLLWSGVILYAGLRFASDHDQSAALSITGVMVLIGLLFSLV